MRIAGIPGRGGEHGPGLRGAAIVAHSEQDRCVSGHRRWRRDRQRTAVQWISVAWDDSGDDVLAGWVQLSCGIARAPCQLRVMSVVNTTTLPPLPFLHQLGLPLRVRHARARNRFCPECYFSLPCLLRFSTRSWRCSRPQRSWCSVAYVALPTHTSRGTQVSIAPSTGELL